MISLSSDGEEFMAELISEMCKRFSIGRDEAVEIINGHWGHFGHFEDDDLIFHEMPEYWAVRIYEEYAKDFYRWRPEGETESTPTRQRSIASQEQGIPEGE